MNQNFDKVVTACSVLLGIGLWVGFSIHLNNVKTLDYDVNPACVKGSPYGKVLALAMQGPIDLYWHNGETHESAEILDKEHQHADGTVHSHTDHNEEVDDHADHGDVIFEASAENKQETLAENKQEALPKAVEKKAVTKVLKGEIKLMGATAKRKTDGSPLSRAHGQHLQSVIEDKLRLAYELDPTNYTNYGNLHLFFSVNLGKTAYDDSKAQKLAIETLEICKKEEVDPAPWLTATSAAYNIVFHIGRYHNEYTEKDAKASLDEFDKCAAVFEEMLNDAVINGRVVSKERLEEFQKRVKYLRKLRHAQGVYMKRMMSKRAFGNLDSQSTDK